MAAYTKAQRRTAKELRFALVTFAFDFHACESPSGGVEFTGPMPDDLAREALRLLTPILEERSRRLKESARDAP